jgi:hypothetical protein
MGHEHEFPSSWSRQGDMIHRTSWTVACVSQLLFVAWLLNMYFSGKCIYFIQSFGMLAVPICMLALLPTDICFANLCCHSRYVCALDGPKLRLLELEPEPATI